MYKSSKARLTRTLQHLQTEHDLRYQICTALAFNLGDQGLLMRCLTFLLSNEVDNVLALVEADNGPSASLNDISSPKPESMKWLAR
jgi:hypothetical protein